MKRIYLAGGCFWGVEEYFSRIEGVIDTEVGYANGYTENPTYEEVCRYGTGHAETVRIDYDESRVSLEELLDRFWRIIDPTLINRQGPDIGSQYRTGIFYEDEGDLPVIEASVEKERVKYDLPLQTEVEPLRKFFEAEEYHQDYLKKNPNGYCHINLDK